jgi:hypothetical protein
MKLEGPKKGAIEEVLGNILGYPDNVKLAASGDLWIAIPALRDGTTNMIDQNPAIRKVMLNLRVPLSLFLLVANMKYDVGIKVNRKTWEVVDYFFGDSAEIECISGINENNHKLYLSSLTTDKIAIVDLLPRPASTHASSNDNARNAKPQLVKPPNGEQAAAKTVHEMGGKKVEGEKKRKESNEL